MKFKNKKEFTQFIKTQTNVEIENDSENALNKKRNILHTEINLVDKNIILSLLKKYNILYEAHVGNSYFIYVK